MEATILTFFGDTPGHYFEIAFMDIQPITIREGLRNGF